MKGKTINRGIAQLRKKGSGVYREGAHMLPCASLMIAEGVMESLKDLKKPFVTIINSYTTQIPGHAHLDSRRSSNASHRPSRPTVFLLQGRRARLPRGRDAQQTAFLHDLPVRRPPVGSRPPVGYDSGAIASLRCGNRGIREPLFRPLRTT